MAVSHLLPCLKLPFYLCRLGLPWAFNGPSLWALNGNPFVLSMGPVGISTGFPFGSQWTLALGPQ